VIDLRIVAAAAAGDETSTVAEPATAWLAVARLVPVVHENLTAPSVDGR
jgi:hypothetical protein